MAQALDERVPPFILQMFGTNGTSTACDTIRRWHYMEDELKKYVILHENIFFLNQRLFVSFSAVYFFDTFRYDIELVGISTDGDPKCLSAMVYEASLLNQSGITCTQDFIHIGTKARGRLLKEGIKLKMGTHEVSVVHLQQLLKKLHKSVHGLTHSDVFPVDRMNYDSFQKIVQDRVLDSLKTNIPESEATIHYLRTFRDILDSFLQTDLKPLDRILRMWRGLYFLRIWREFIKSSSFYNLSNNFITYNTYMCVEINANSLIHLIKYFRDHKTSEQFLPALFDSQTCERAFRLFRSMGTTQFTKINFSILELIHMIGRLEVQNSIVYSKLNIEGIELPHKRKEKTIIYELPSDDEIHDAMQNAKREAFETAEQFGIFVDTEKIDNFKFVSRLKFNENDEESYEELCDEECEPEIIEYEDIDQNHEAELDFEELNPCHDPCCSRPIDDQGRKI